jgi:hypothetical protein
MEVEPKNVLYISKVKFEYELVGAESLQDTIKVLLKDDDKTALQLL